MKPTIALLAVLLPVAFAAGAEPTLVGEARARYTDAVAKVTAGAHGPATEVLNGLAAQYPRVPEIFATRCAAQLGLAHYAAAEADCTYALAVRPNMPAALYALAVAEEKLGKIDLAISHFRTYAALDDPQAAYKPQAIARANALQSPGQAGLPLPPPPPPPSEPMSAPLVQAMPAQAAATLFVYRNHMLANTSSGRAQHVSLYLDGKIVGDIGHDQYVEIQTGAGSHFLESRFAVDNIFEVGRMLSVPVELSANGQAYVSFDIHGGQLQMTVVPPEQGRKEIREDCKKAYSRKM